jgi:hypothetical protein
MKDGGKFDTACALWKAMLPHGAERSALDAAVLCADTLDICWAAAQDIFGDRAAPEHAVAMFERLMNERARRIAAAEKSPDAEP